MLQEGRQAHQEPWRRRELAVERARSSQLEGQLEVETARSSQRMDRVVEL